MKNFNFIFNAKYLVLIIFLISFSTLSAQTVDTDGDGVLDQLDLDDDNDGIPDAAECSITPVNMASWFNGSNVFPPTIAAPYSTFVTGQNSTAGGGLTRSWITPANYQELTNIAATTEAQAITNSEYVEYRITVGSRYLVLNQVDYYISPTAIDNTTYVYTLRMSVDNFATNSLVHGAQNYTPGAAGVNATINTAQTFYLSPSTTYTFRVYFYNVAGGAPSTIAHDDFKLRGAFECDNDTDLIPNRLDLNSDGDTCFDSIEGDENVLLNQLNANGSINIATTGGIGTTLGTNNGVPNLVNTGGSADVGTDVGQGIGISQNSNIQDVQCSTSIGCTNAMYLSQTATLYNIDTSSNPFTYPTIGTASVNYNAIGINPLDGRMYGLQQASTNVVVINPDGTSVNLGPPIGLPAGTYTAGEIDNLGNYYVIENVSSNQLYRINLSTMTATSITLSSSITIFDMAYSVTNSRLYAVSSTNGQLLSINPTNGAVALIGIQPGAVSFGAMFASSTGEIYGSENTGGFYQFNIANGQRVLISGSPASGSNDGAHCVTTPIVFSADLSVTKSNGSTTYLQGTSTIYTVIVRNNGPFGVLNASVSDPVPTGIPAANVSYTAAVAGGATTTVSGTQIGAISDVVNLPVNGTVTYTITVNIPAAFTDSLVNTATVTPPANSTDSNTANNTATDTDTPYCTGTDSDGDGIPDVCDLDDDNDGILDAVESPNCFFAASEARSMINSITSQFPALDNFNLLNNYIVEATAAAGFNFDPAVPAASNPVGSNLFTIEFARAIELGSIILTDNISNTAAARARLFGSNDNINYVQLTTAESNINTGTGTTFTINQNVGKYRYYRIQTTVAGGIAVADFIGEIIPVVAANYIASEYPKGTCTDDQDGDGTVNHLDLDADGDGCFDAVEGDENVTSAQLTAGRIIGAVDAWGVPVLVNSGGAADIGGDQGQGIGQARSADRNDCLDSDADTIPDWIDMDDDNDGILDTAECPDNYIVRPIVTSSITTLSTITSGNIQTIANAEGAGGTGNGTAPHWYTNVRNLPIIINMNMQAASTMDHIKLYGPWGFDERMKDFKIELYNSGNVLLGTENLIAPDQYTVPTILSFSKEYTNVTRVVFTIISDQGYSGANPPRVSLSEIVFLDLQICDTDGDGIPNRLDLDSDNDGCLDAIEGDENVLNAQLVDAADGLSAGFGSTALDQNLCSTNTCVNANGVPNLVNSGGTADIGNDVGQGIGSSIDAAINTCFCTQPPTGGTPDGFTMVGVSAHAAQISGWPENVGNGFIALDSQTKGFVITRVGHVGGTDGTPVPADDIADPVEGMMVYDIDDNCVKLFNGDIWKCIERGCNTPPPTN